MNLESSKFPEFQSYKPDTKESLSSVVLATLALLFAVGVLLAWAYIAQ